MSKYEECPMPGCNNTGGYQERVLRTHPFDRDRCIEDWELVQCEFCYTNPNSVFNNPPYEVSNE